MWIGTTGNGLNYYNKATGDFKHYTHNKKDSNSLINNHINILFKDKKEMLWIGTSNGLDLVDLKKTNQKKEKDYTTTRP
ncbi:two-component regulator propeller domain-containing protein [Polaribacter ponticola]|uniref:Two-component regulator propeller domain-containing protein n=1 Tax=Polaribacter ponticola TaxID=2978475 RepID=A0ABT5S7Q8_9FLAO|nr:two-component regulator propeller domain-containing protein [Polaribacter sp. MSW5]MDD7914143.1 two-component regulator propeller domain-containing protein [Polaribacter sp. MSW5]